MKFKDGSACPAPDVEALARDYEQARDLGEVRLGRLGLYLPGSPRRLLLWRPSPTSTCVWRTSRWAWAAPGPRGAVFSDGRSPERRKL